MLDPLDDLLERIGLDRGPQSRALHSLVHNAFPDPNAVVAQLNRIPAVLLQSLAAVTPTADQLSCSHGNAPMPRTVQVLLGGQVIALCNA